MAAVLCGKSARLVAFGTLSSALALSCASSVAVAATVPPSMTILILNNSCKVGACPSGQKPYNIYPVLSTGTSTPDKYMQAILGVPSGQVGGSPFPKTNQFRLYLNPTGNGIPPGGSLTLTLPFYSQLVPTNEVDPTKPDQYIDWWGGGRIEIFDGDATTGQPPAALIADFNGTNPARAKQVQVTPIEGSALPVLSNCTPGLCQTLTIFKDPAGLTNNEPSQLTEYTLGALNFNVSASAPYGLDLHNVDYDVSYVDATYMPAAMEPYNNTQVGYIGTIQAIDPFRTAVQSFLTKYSGWPQFLNDQKVKILKVPSPINLFAGLESSTNRTDLATVPPWAPITALINQWNTCTAKNGSLPVCPDIVDVRNLVAANYVWCTGSAPDGSLEAKIISHTYGWTPFNTNPGDQQSKGVNCPNQPSDTHLLEDTPGYWTQNSDGSKNYAKYQAVKQEFDDLQYWPSHSTPDGTFDPYLLLIHGKSYINTDRAYAYSVDDALGNMQVAGDGLIIAVGGSGGLPNPNPATPPINIQFGYTLTTGAVNFTMYGVCSDNPDRNVNPTFTSFAISATNPTNCPLSFVDSLNRVYKFIINNEPPYPIGPPQAGVPIADKYYYLNSTKPRSPTYIDCSGNPAGSFQSMWCLNPPASQGGPVAYGVYVYTLKGNGNASTNQNFAVARPACSASSC
jgi:hypothetical protein